MASKVSAAQAKAQLSALVAQVAYGGAHFIIERRGKPLAALVRIDELEQLQREGVATPRPLGALALVGAWREVDDKDLDALFTHIYSQRAQDTGRPVMLEA